MPERNLGQNEDVRSPLALAFVGATICWLFVLCLAPFFPAPLAAITYALGSFVCHQRAERSFHLGEMQLPVCARCTGLYAGAALASLGWVFIGRRGSGFTPSVVTREGPPDGIKTDIVRRRDVVSRRLLIPAAVPTAITVVLEWAGVWQPSNIVRATAGIPLGLAAALVVIGALTTLHYDECAPRPPIGPPPRRTPI